MPQRVKVQSSDPNVQQISNGVDQMMPGAAIIEYLKKLLTAAPAQQPVQPPRVEDDGRDFVIIPQKPPQDMAQPFDVSSLNQSGRDAEQSALKQKAGQR